MDEKGSVHDVVYRDFLHRVDWRKGLCVRVGSQEVLDDLHEEENIEKFDDRPQHRVSFKAKCDAVSCERGDAVLTRKGCR